MTRVDRLKEVGRLLGFALLFTVSAGVFLGNASDAVLVQGGGVLLAGVLSAGILLRLEGQSLSTLGLARRLAGRELFKGTALGIGVALPALMLAPVVGGLRWTSDGGTGLEYVATGAWTLTILLLPAAAEEILFRGYPMRVLLRAWGPGVALAVTSLGFAALHGGNPGVGPVALANIALAGLLLGLVYLKTGSLWWAIGVHAGWNFATAFLADLPVSGVRIVDSPLVEVGRAGRDIVTGGAFGLEGGLAGTLALALGIGFLWWKPIPEPSVPALVAGSRAPLGRVAPLYLHATDAPRRSDEGLKTSSDADD